MYSNKENVNILTSLLVAHGVRHAVVCPGSRNAPIVHNLTECPAISCHAVTDERSAAFYALGMTQATGSPVVVCVTSGTALLNTAPAVAEAYYQRRPLIVVSADRPPQWIDQQDGQTLPQGDALGRFVTRAVSLPEPSGDGVQHSAGGQCAGGESCADETRWYCNRLVNEALLATCRGPVHINVPITEPLFRFDVAELPSERCIELLPADIAPHTLSHVVRSFLAAERPMLVSGQPLNALMDEAVSLVADDPAYVPSLVVYAGGSIVSKRLKHFLRRAKEVWVVNAEGSVTDTFMNLTRVIEGDPAVVADQLRFALEQQPHPFVSKWETLLSEVRRRADSAVLPYSPAAAVRYFEARRGAAVVHYANSTAIRLANTYARCPVYCNRGVNGIEGSLSTAAGFSTVVDEPVFCVIGDLSFFYDQNALWNTGLRGNLRVLLLNNGHGAIFDTLPGLEASAARDTFVAGRHHATAEGICRQNGIAYLRATDMNGMQQAVDRLFDMESPRPVVAEILF